MHAAYLKRDCCLQFGLFALHFSSCGDGIREPLRKYKSVASPHYKLHRTACVCRSLPFTYNTGVWWIEWLIGPQQSTVCISIFIGVSSRRKLWLISIKSVIIFLLLLHFRPISVLKHLRVYSCQTILKDRAFVDKLLPYWCFASPLLPNWEPFHLASTWRTPLIACFFLKSSPAPLCSFSNVVCDSLVWKNTVQNTFAHHLDRTNFLQHPTQAGTFFFPVSPMWKPFFSLQVTGGLFF